MIEREGYTGNVLFVSYLESDKLQMYIRNAIKRGLIDGIDIRVDFWPADHRHAGKVSTAYPTNTPRNPPRPPLALNPPNQ